MGVTGLWKLVDSAGKPVPLETLENKILAIDISIWLHQVVKGFQDASGSALPHAHLLGLFHRLCKLLYYKIKPVFVFDGGVPDLKRETIRKRIQSKRTFNSEADRLQQMLLESLAKEKIVQQALGASSALLATPPKDKNKKNRSAEPSPDDLYKLPPLKEVDSSIDNESTNNSGTNLESDSSFDEKNPRNYYNINIHNIDVNSSHFKALPADVRHEILTDLKEKRKESSWGRLHELPAESNDFSSFQMKRLLKRRQVQVGLESAEQEMGGKCLSLGELEAMLAEEGVVEASSSSNRQTLGKRIASDENTRFLHIRDLKKAIKEEEDAIVTPPKVMKLEEEVNEVNKSTVVDAELDADLALAIQMSLEEVPIPEPSRYDEVKLRSDQKKQLAMAAKDLAKAYMIEYAGMNDEDVAHLVKHDEDEEDHIDPTFKYNDASILGAKPEAVSNFKDSESSNNEETASVKETKEEVIDLDDSSDDGMSSNADSDFVDVPEFEEGSDVSLSGAKSTLVFHTNLSPSADLQKDFRHSDLMKPVIDIIIKPDLEKLENDLFADVFAKGEIEPTTGKFNKVKVTEKVPLNQVEVTNLEKESSKNTLSSKIQENSFETKIGKPENTPKIPAENILNELQSQMDSIGNINLDNILPSTSQCAIKKPSKTSALEDILGSLNKEMIEVKEKFSLKLSNEVIEINDDDDDDDELTPNKRDKQSLISNFINVTPKSTKKSNQIVDEQTPSVKSPFFRKKTPNSSISKTKNHSLESEADQGEKLKVSKNLFGPSDKNDDVDAIELAANILRDQKTESELKAIASEAKFQSKELAFEKNRQERMGMSITERMSEDCQRLLKLFGIPYITAPMEAEAQCAFLDLYNLTDGTITDDSDIWLFGGKTVYKHFFNQQKNVMEFRAEQIEKVFNVNRTKLIQLSMLVGSDYTNGISGIGAVTALEILASFCDQNQESIDDTLSMLRALRKFKEWWASGRKVGPKTTALRSKLKNIQLTDEFPSGRVIEAYTNPIVDKSLEKFAWGHPDAETIREFAKQTFGWTYSKTNDILLPVLKKIDEKTSQQSIKNYFEKTGTTLSVDLHLLGVSKRVQKAVKTMSKDYDPSQEEKPKEKKKRTTMKKPNLSLSTKKNKRKTEAEKQVHDETEEVEVVEEASTSSSSLEIKRTVAKAPLRVPDFKPPIPQREKDKDDQEKYKIKAIELFKKTKSIKKKTIE